MKMRKLVTATFVASQAILLLNETATGFHVNRCSHVRHEHHRGQHRHSARRHLASTDDDSSPSWEEQLREEATDVLLPVFFPDSNQNPSRQKPITAEASLKKLLRKKYQREKDNAQEQHTGTTNNNNNNAYRGRLAALTLGTSVMRLRHWYVVAVSESGSCTQGHGVTSTVPIPSPLDHTHLSLVPKKDTDDGKNGRLEPSSAVSDNQNHNNLAEERLLVREMVDEHARYLSTANPVHADLLPNSNNNTSINLSIQYSLPSFLTKSLLSHYGYAQTNDICSLMNEPGPITIRRNAIQFPGTDGDLCKWLWEEDGVRVEPLINLLEGNGNISDGNMEDNVQFRQNNELSVTKPSDGSNMYVIGSFSKSGSVVPPEGTIQILPPRANATTAVEKRRSNKSIWSMKGWQSGYFEVQDAGSQIIVQSVEATPGDSVLDYCAGNGGKTFALASSIMNAADDDCCSGSSHNTTNDKALRSSRIVAHDVVDDRLRQIRGSSSRVGFVVADQEEDDIMMYSTQSNHSNGKCTIQIATSSDLEDSNNTHSNLAQFDAVLVDAPCSSTGVLRRRPSQRWDITEKQIFEELPELQLEILKNASSFVMDDGGKLVYSTCSLLREENECVVRQFEQSDAFLSGGFERWEIDPIVSNAEAGGDLDRDLAREECSHTLTLLPSEYSDGFFIARWKKKPKR